MRDHVTQTHLHPVFRREVPGVPEASRLRMRVLNWLADQILGPNRSVASQAESVDSTLVFPDPNATLTSNLREAMDALCRYEGVTPPLRPIA